MALKLLLAHLGFALIASAEGLVIGSSEQTLLDLKGPPTSQMRVGSKAIYYWDDAEVTVADGKVISIKAPRPKPPVSERKPVANSATTKVASASPPSTPNYLDRALGEAAGSGRLLFIKYGRPECGNCQSLQQMLDAGRLPMGEGKFNILDVNCDRPEQDGLFDKKYGALFKEVTSLPFVLVVDPGGRVLATRHGAASFREYVLFIKTAKSAYGSE